MDKNKRLYIKIPIPELNWKHICLIILIILAFRLDSNKVSNLLQWIMNKFSSN